MFFEDFVLRQIAQAVMVMAKILGLSKSGNYQEAYALIDQAISELIGLDAIIVKQMDDVGLIDLLTNSQGIDCGKVYILAELFKVEGDVLSDQGRNEESRSSYQRALMLYYQYAEQCPDGLTKEVQEKVKSLEKEIL